MTRVWPRRLQQCDGAVGEQHQQDPPQPGSGTRSRGVRPGRGLRPLRRRSAPLLRLRTAAATAATTAATATGGPGSAAAAARTGRLARGTRARASLALPRGPSRGHSRARLCPSPAAALTLGRGCSGGGSGSGGGCGGGGHQP
jgi:hypothetical protein